MTASSMSEVAANPTGTIALQSIVECTIWFEQAERRVVECLALITRLYFSVP